MPNRYLGPLQDQYFFWRGVKAWYCVFLFLAKKDYFKLTYRHFKGTASWRDSDGDYGNLKCLGNYVSSKEDRTTLNNYCQGTNKDGDVFWLTMVRKSTDYDRGIGQSEYIYD